jgi:hypothetical protein
LPRFERNDIAGSSVNEPRGQCPENDMAGRWKEQDGGWGRLARPEEVLYREIQRKIGEELKERYQPPEELTPYLLTLLATINEMQGRRACRGAARAGQRPRT